MNNNRTINKIAIFVPNKPFFGAILVQIPFFENVIRNFPEAKITVFSPVSQMQLFVKLGYINELKLYKRRKYFSDILLPLRKIKPDIVINMRPKSEILNFCVLFSGTRQRYGFETSRFGNWVYKKTVPFNVYRYIALNYLALAYSLPLKNKIGLDVINKFQEKEITQIESTRKYICFMPGGGEGEYKRWGVDNFCKLALELIKKDMELQFVFILGDQEKDMIDTIKAKLDKNNHKILLNPEIKDIVRITKNSAVTVANDCGPSHISQMSGANYLGVWGYKGEESPFYKIREWYLPRDNSIIITASEKEKDIKSIRPLDIALIIKSRFL